MLPEIPHPNPEQTPVNALNLKQDVLIARIHSLDEEKQTGDTFFGPMNIYREPQAITLRIRNNGSTISLDQDRCETDELGVRSRITLIYEAITESGKSTETYRCNGEKAVKRYINGEQPVTGDMTEGDFEKAYGLLEAIDSMLTSSLASHM